MIVGLPQINTISCWPVSTLATIGIRDYGVEGQALRAWGKVKAQPGGADPTGAVPQGIQAPEGRRGGTDEPQKETTLTYLNILLFPYCVNPSIISIIA